MSNNSLTSFLLDDNKRKHLDWSRNVEIIIGIADGLSYLHNVAAVNLIHRDIKAPNILLDDRMVAKIADFGTAKNVNDDNPISPKGTIGYWDPQYYAYGMLSTKSDVYSFGVIILEMLTGMKSQQLEKKEKEEVKKRKRVEKGKKDEQDKKKIAKRKRKKKVQDDEDYELEEMQSEKKKLEKEFKSLRAKTTMMKRKWPAIKNWTNKDVLDRENLEMLKGKIGLVELIEDDDKQDENEKDAEKRKLRELIYETIEEKFERVLKEKRELEDLLKEYMDMDELFIGDEKLQLFVKSFQEEFTTRLRKDEDRTGTSVVGHKE
ncbi:200 kDa antigen p200 [Tanacetum coccineum]